MPPTIEESERELERFSRGVGSSVAVEALSASERRARWGDSGRSGSVTSSVLRSGVALSLSTVRWERSWSVSIDQRPAALKFVLLRGRGPRLTTSDGADLSLDGGMLHLGSINRPVRMTFAFEASPVPATHEELSAEIEPKRLCELLGSSVLPDPVEALLGSERAYPFVSVPMGPALLRTFDDLIASGTRGATRMLHQEAVGLELVAAALDRIEESARVASHLSPHHQECLENARTRLLAQMEDPPSLAELARAVGLNEFKLKAGFRALFGQPVFAYLRDQRMQKARELLSGRRHSVAEVALMVGYRNPSKFAAAFRKRFGIRPSALN
ncbi:MAG: helix-turn-helix transcriptional regulator [Nannocystales bacterium]